MAGFSSYTDTLTTQHGLHHKYFCFTEPDRLVGQVVKASVEIAVDAGSFPAFSVEIFPDRVIPVT